MSDYARLRINVEVSEQSDYGRPYVNTSLACALTPDEVFDVKVDCDTGGGTTFTTSMLSSISLVLVENLDTTNYVELTFRSVANGATNNKVRLAAGDVCVLRDVTAANNLAFVANTAAVKVRLIIMGT